MIEEASVLSGLVVPSGGSSGYIPWLNRTPNLVFRICATRISGACSWDSKKLEFPRFLLLSFTFIFGLEDGDLVLFSQDFDGFHFY